MNEKMANQIAEMKKQTIGVEVEMNNITRERQQALQPNSLQPTDTNTQPRETDTTLGRLGTHRAENGNSKGM